MKYDIFRPPLCNTTTIRIPRPKMVFKKPYPLRPPEFWPRHSARHLWCQKFSEVQFKTWIFKIDKSNYGNRLISNWQACHQLRLLASICNEKESRKSFIFFLCYNLNARIHFCPYQVLTCSFLGIHFDLIRT